MENVEARITMTRVVHRRNGTPRQAGLLAIRMGQRGTVEQYLVHSTGKDVITAKVISDPEGDQRREGNPSEVISRTEEMGLMEPITMADLNRSRGTAEGELRKLLAQP